MSQSSTPEFTKKIVRLRLEEGRTYKSITAEYGVSIASISKWCAEFSEECHTKAQQNPDAPNDLELMKENLRLRKASLQSMVYQKPVSPNGVLNLAKNAIQKPSRIQMLLMIWNL